ncbi:predicted protein [Pyrenophora tritici-repentis Pt-1C-BFP]|uniref:Uncharacterized protein n=1 Tax=Pyrenophora tritici-repentis (strain Pt-1C-BFP) TaxID=426418 RepID=B2WLG2_PYRTR|nr:uncharacterized protein PTRG_10822 [Pyrenophora tritici-repentis Pt-1C-BFP]EDU43872.1 predicted protein [Pyrenophora tritici-repentis Pt-1C-BFP]
MALMLGWEANGFQQIGQPAFIMENLRLPYGSVSAEQPTLTARISSQAGRFLKPE